MNPAWTRWAICLLVACAIGGEASATRTRSFRIEGADAFSEGEDERRLRQRRTERSPRGRRPFSSSPMRERRSGPCCGPRGRHLRRHRLGREGRPATGTGGEGRRSIRVRGLHGRGREGRANLRLGRAQWDGCGDPSRWHRLDALRHTGEDRLVDPRRSGRESLRGDGGSWLRLPDHPRRAGDGSVPGRGCARGVPRVDQGREDRRGDRWPGSSDRDRPDPVARERPLRRLDAGDPTRSSSAQRARSTSLRAVLGRKATRPAGGRGEDRSPGEQGGSSLYLRAPDGTVRLLWQLPGSDDPLPLPGRRGKRAGRDGRQGRPLPRHARPGMSTLLWRPEEGQVLSLLRDGEGIVAATGNPGRIYRLSAGAERRHGSASSRWMPGSSAAWGGALWEVLPGKRILAARGRGQANRPSRLVLERMERSPHRLRTGRWWRARRRDSSRPRRDSFPAARGPFAPAADLDPVQRAESPPRVPRSGSPQTRSRAGKDGPDRGRAIQQDLGGGFASSTSRRPGLERRECGPPPWVRDVRSIAWDASDPEWGRPRLRRGAPSWSARRSSVTLVRDHPTGSTR